MTTILLLNKSSSFLQVIFFCVVLLLFSHECYPLYFYCYRYPFSSAFTIIVNVSISFFSFLFFVKIDAYKSLYTERDISKTLLRDSKAVFFVILVGVGAHVQQ